MIRKYKAFHHGSKLFYKVLVIDFENEVVFVESEFQGVKNRYALSFDVVELLQWTGLKDSKGKKLYEGDVVKIKGHYMGEGYYETNAQDVDKVGIVEWYSDDAFYRIGGWSYEDISGFYDLKLKKIGNVLQNPELEEETY